MGEAGGSDRSYWEQTGLRLLAGAAKYSSEDGSAILIPGRASASGRKSDGLEGFARSLLLCAFLVRGGGPSVFPASDLEAILDKFVRGITSGASGGWPGVKPYSQTIVEAATISLSLRIVGEALWGRLDPDTQLCVARWLRLALHAPVHRSNWQLFPVTIAGFLDSVGLAEPRDLDRSTAARRSIEKMYIGHGWYRDGLGPAYDYYNSWSFHFYPMLDAFLSNDAARISVFGDRLALFLESFPGFIADGGAPILFGRSLTYRFALTTAISMGSLVSRSPLAPSLARRTVTNCLRYFVDSGATDHDLLSVGWNGPNDSIAQSYSGAGSPYWASKAFVCLLVPPSDVFWTSTADTAGQPVSTAISGTSMLVDGGPSRQIAKLYNHGSESVEMVRDRRRPLESLYSRFAYSSATQPIPDSIGRDNTVTLTRSGKTWVRGAFRPMGSGADWASSRCRPFPVESTTRPFSDNRRLVRLVPWLSARRPARIPIDSLTRMMGRDSLIVHRIRVHGGATTLAFFGWPIATAGQDPLADIRDAGVLISGPTLIGELVSLHGGSEVGFERSDFDGVFGRPSTPVIRTKPLGPGVHYLVALSSLRSTEDTSSCAVGSGTPSVEVVDDNELIIRREGFAPFRISYSPRNGLVVAAN